MAVSRAIGGVEAGVVAAAPTGSPSGDRAAPVWFAVAPLVVSWSLSAVTVSQVGDRTVGVGTAT